MTRILFVDDEAALLDALRVRLRPMRQKWEMTFVDGGELALQQMQQAPFDIVVSDVRMSGMPGTWLLKTVSERWPHTVRIALSGVVDPSEALQLTPVAHRFLSKPCEPPVLEETLERCIALRDLLRSPALLATAGGIRQLPALRGTYASLQAAMLRENVRSHEVADIIARDTVIAAKVLQIVSSAFFRRGRRITNLEQAVTYLGFGALRSIVLSAEVFSLWPERPGKVRWDMDRLQQHCLNVVSAADALTSGTPFADDAVTAALLHDFGYWVLANECPRELTRALELSLSRAIPLHVAEKEVIGASHAELGAYLLGIWGLPESVIEAVAFHHTPEQVRQSEFDVLAALAVAHALAPTDDSAVFDGPPPPDPAVGPAYLESIRSPFSWEEARQRVSSRTTAAECEA